MSSTDNGTNDLRAANLQMPAETDAIDEIAEFTPGELLQQTPNSSKTVTASKDDQPTAGGFIADPSPLLTLPFDHAKPWVVEMLSYFRGISADDNWQVLVSEWAHFESFNPPEGVRNYLHIVDGPSIFYYRGCPLTHDPKRFPGG